MNKKLYRNEHQKVIGGVCSGLAEYFEMDVTIVRLLFVFGVCVVGVSFWGYFILWMVLPRKDYLYNRFNNPGVDYTVPPQQAGDFTPPLTGSPFGSSTFASSSPGSNPFGNNPFGDNRFGGTSFNNNPKAVPPKQKSNAGVIIGLVLIMIGAAILIEEYDLIPDFDFGTYWPVILVVVGGAMIVSGQKKQPWDKKDWSEETKAETPVTEEPSSSTDSNPTV